jgi:hypothetical protein
MAASSRRKGMVLLSFDMLEERSLLSHFSMPGFSDWGFPGAHPGAPPPAFSGAPDRSPGPFEGGPSVFSQARSPSVSAQTSQAAPQVAAVTSSNSFAPPSSIVPAAVPRATAPGPGPALAPVDPDIAQAIVASTATSNPGVLSPVASKPLETAPGTVSVLISGLGRMVPVTVGLIVPDILLGRAWGAQPGPSSHDQETFLVPGSSSERDPSSMTARRSPNSLPSPRGADLITDYGAFGRTPIGDCLKQLFGGPSTADGTSSRPISNPSYLLPIALAVAGLDAARRWRKGSKRALRGSRRERNSLLIGLPRTSRR